MPGKVRDEAMVNVSLSALSLKNPVAFQGSCPNISRPGLVWQTDQHTGSCPLLWGLQQHKPPAAAFLDDETAPEKLVKPLETKSHQAKTPGECHRSLKRWLSRLESGRTWAVLFFALIPMNFINGIDYVSFSIYYVAFAEHFPTETRFSIGVIVAIRETVSCCFGLVTGALIRRYGPLTTCILSGVVLSVGLLASSFAPNVQILYFTQGVLSGVAYSLNFLTANYVLQKNFTTNRALGSGLGMLGYTAGNFVGALFIDFLIETYGWRGALLIHAALMANYIVFGALVSALRPELMAPTKDEVTTSSTDSLDNLTSTQNLRIKVRTFLRVMFDFSLFKNSSFVLTCLGTMMFRWNKLTLYQHIPSRAVSLGMTRSEGADLIAVAFLAAVLSRIVVIPVSNGVNRVFFYNSGFVAAAAANFTIAACASLLGQQVGSVLAGIQTGISDTLFFVVLVDLFTIEQLAKSMVLAEMSFLVPSLATAPLGGYLYDVTGSYEATFYLSGALVSLGGLLVLIVAVRDVMSTSPLTETSEDDVS